MEILLHDGKKEVIFGGSDGEFYLGYKKNRKNKETKEPEEYWQAEKFYASPAQAMDALLKMRVSNSEAKTLEELKEIIARERKALTEFYKTAA